MACTNSGTVLVTGGRGLVGTALNALISDNCRKLPWGQDAAWHFADFEDGDLRVEAACQALFTKVRPTYVFHLAAKVGGLFANSSDNAGFFRHNMDITRNVMSCCKEFGVEKCVCCLSTCIYPDGAQYPIHEEGLHQGLPHETNIGYAYSKRMMHVLAEIMNEDEDCRCKFICVCPCNTYGINDNFCLDFCHVVPALIRKCIAAKAEGGALYVRGHGNSRRQFLYSKDLAQMLLWAMSSLNDHQPVFLSVDVSDEISIRQLVNEICKAVNFTGEVKFESDEIPDAAQYQRTASNSKFRSCCPEFVFTPIAQGISETVHWFMDPANSTKLRKEPEPHFYPPKSEATDDVFGTSILGGQGNMEMGERGYDNAEQSLPRCVLVTGGSGMVGSALRVGLPSLDKSHPLAQENCRWVFLSSKDADLRCYSSTERAFHKYKPTHVIHLAARVGGLYANLRNQKVFLLENLRITDNVMECCRKGRVTKLITCLSTCVYPDPIEYPVDETQVHAGPPPGSNKGYAHAKRVGEVMSQVYRHQYNCNFVSIIPPNIYGPYDNFSLEDSHVVPGLIHKCYLARKEGHRKLKVFGTGRARRQFIFSKDLASLILWVLESYEEKDPIILCPDETDELSIAELARLIKSAMGFDGDLEFDMTKSDGQLRKTAKNQKLRKLHPTFKFTSMADGLAETASWFAENFETARK